MVVQKKIAQCMCGSASIDDCGVCDGDGTSCLGCTEQDIAILNQENPF